MKRILIALIIIAISVLAIDYTVGFGSSSSGGGGSTVIKKDDPEPIPPKEEIFPVTLHFMPDFDIYTSEGWNEISQNNSERSLTFAEGKATFTRSDTNGGTKIYRLTAPIVSSVEGVAVGLSMDYAIHMRDSEVSEHGVYLRLYSSLNGVYITTKKDLINYRFTYNFKAATVAELDKDWTLNYGNTNYPLGTALAQYGKNMGLSINDIFNYFTDIQVIIKSTHDTTCTISNLSLYYE